MKNPRLIARSIGVYAALFILFCGGCDSARTDASSDPPKQESTKAAPETWGQLVAEHLGERYGKPGMGMANRDANALVQYVARYPAEDHIVYVTSGASSHKFPHEFVMRIDLDGLTAENIGERAPGWPDRVLAEIAQTEARSGRVFAPGDHLSHMRLEGVPYHHFVFFTDPVLEPIEGPGEEPLFFVQVVPLTDPQLSELAAVPEGEAIPLIKDWARRDPLLLVRPNPNKD